MTTQDTIEERVENLDFIRTVRPDGTEFLEVKRNDLVELLKEHEYQIRKETIRDMQRQAINLKSAEAAAEWGDEYLKIKKNYE